MEVKIKLLLNYLLKLPCYLMCQYVMHFLPYSTVRYRCIVFIASGKIPELEGAFHHPVSMDIFPTIGTSVSPIYLVDEFHILFFLFLTPLKPTQQRTRWRNLVCVECL